MSDTPMTDRARSECRSLEDLFGCQPLERVARKMERELAAAHAARDAAIADADECRIHRVRERDRAEKLEKELAAVTEKLRVVKEVNNTGRQLALQLQNAAYTHGYEDAHPSQAWTLQDKAFASSKEKLNAVCVELDRLTGELAAVTAERDALRADARRYRWLRGNAATDWSARWSQWEVRCWQAPFWTGDLRLDRLDAAIDAAIAASEEKP